MENSIGSIFQKKRLYESTQPVEIIHTDVCGPMSVNSVDGSRYFVTFIDDYTRQYQI